MSKIAIIGAGLSGTTLARRLSERANVQVFEKSRGIGGRMATRYAGIYEFDHGAQYFTARTDAFKEVLQPLIKEGVVSEWKDKIVSIVPGQTPTPFTRDDPIYVAAPRMNALPKALANGAEMTVRCQIEGLSRSDSGSWTLKDNEGGEYGPFDWVVSTAPSIQTAALFPEDVSFAEQLSAVRMPGCFSVLLGLDQDPGIEWAGAKVTDSPIGWIAVNSAKPGRQSSTSIVVQTTNDWAEDNLERDQGEVRDLICRELNSLIGLDASGTAHQSLHRWRYAHTSVPAGAPFLIDEAQGLAACGDWCLGGRVESAFTSATELADALSDS
ncbi:MAG: FAD-dependent oxidoreductase [Pseudomonadota bacterium]